MLLRSCLKDMVYDGHVVTNVHVPANSSIVKIGESEYENDHIPSDEPKLVQMIMENKKMDKRMLREKHPEISKHLQNIFKHVDIRLHGFVFRKCHPRDYQCDYCKENPRRSSNNLWKCLPSKSSGGLFFDVEPDPKMPGHYRTLLDMMKDGKKIKIEPDKVFGDVFGRCKVIQQHSFNISVLEYFHSRRLAVLSHLSARRMQRDTSGWLTRIVTLRRIPTAMSAPSRSTILFAGGASRPTGS